MFEASSAVSLGAIKNATFMWLISTSTPINIIYDVCPKEECVENNSSFSKGAWLRPDSLRVIKMGGLAAAVMASSSMLIETRGKPLKSMKYTKSKADPCVELKLMEIQT